MNLLSEEEAKTKLCPFTFTAPEQRGADGTGIMQGGPWHCLASNCMAWRKKETAKFARDAEREFRQTGRRLESDTGYCGLAGAPT